MFSDVKYAITVQVAENKKTKEDPKLWLSFLYIIAGATTLLKQPRPQARQYEAVATFASIKKEPNKRTAFN